LNAHDLTVRFVLDPHDAYTARLWLLADLDFVFAAELD
jgi:hypothetical protein